jgi:Outer membrane protein beta-barrel domain
MKKALVLLVVSFLIAGSSFAQVKISGGVLAGLNMANVKVDPTPAGVDFSNLTGFAVGGVLNFEFAGGFGIQVEPMYIQNGAKVSSGGTEAKIKANYIDIPAMLVYTFATGQGQVEPYVMAGPVLGIRLSAKETDGSDVDIKDFIKSTNFSGTFGAGVKIPVGMNRVFVEGRYTIGFSDINNGFAPGYTIKTKGLAFFAGITFPFGG